MSSDTEMREMRECCAALIEAIGWLCWASRNIESAQEATTRCHELASALVGLAPQDTDLELPGDEG